MKKKAVTHFLRPLVVPFGLFFVSATVDSFVTRGHALWTETLTLQAVIDHIPLFMHHLYFSFIGYDLAILIASLTLIENRSQLVIEHLGYIILGIVIGIMVHFLAYFHTFHSIQAERPISLLHLFYAPFSLGVVLFVNMHYVRAAEKQRPS